MITSALQRYKRNQTNLQTVNMLSDSIYTEAQRLVRESGYWAETAMWVATMAVAPQTVSSDAIQTRIDELLVDRIQLSSRGDAYGVAETMGRLESLGYKE